MLDISPSQRRALRAKAHHLHPVVTIGQHGLTPPVLHEIDRALRAHELIKVRVFEDDRTQRDALLARICDELDCAPVQHLGKLLIVWRPGDESDAEAPRRATKARPPRKKPAAAPRRGKPVGQAPGARATGWKAPSGEARHPTRRRRAGGSADAFGVGRGRSTNTPGFARSTSAPGGRRGGSAGAAGTRRPHGAASTKSPAGPRGAGDFASRATGSQRRTRGLDQAAGAKPAPRGVRKSAGATTNAARRAPRGVPTSGPKRRRRTG